MPLTRPIMQHLLLLHVAAVALSFCLAKPVGRAFAPPHGAPAAYVCVAAENTRISCLPGENHPDRLSRPQGDPAELALQKRTPPRGAIAAHDGSRFLAKFHRGAGSQKKKPSPGIAGKKFEPCEQRRLAGNTRIHGAALSAKSKSYEAFPFDPRGPCPAFGA